MIYHKRDIWKKHGLGVYQDELRYWSSGRLERPKGKNNRFQGCYHEYFDVFSNLMGIEKFYRSFHDHKEIQAVLRQFFDYGISNDSIKLKTFKFLSTVFLQNNLILIIKVENYLCSFLKCLFKWTLEYALKEQ